MVPHLRPLRFVVVVVEEEEEEELFLVELELFDLGVEVDFTGE